MSPPLLVICKASAAVEIDRPGARVTLQFEIASPELPCNTAMPKPGLV
jgi:hypothetical protein